LPFSRRATWTGETAMSILGPLLAVGVLLAAACGPIAGDYAYPEDYYLMGRSRGPYTGRVIDADTREPLEGAVVVAVWRRDRFGLVHTVSRHYTAREVLTDRDGRFVIDSTALEKQAPRRTRTPEFTIFALGYGFFPRFQARPRNYTGSVLFLGSGTTIELRRLDDANDRRAQISAIDPFGLSPSPFREIPHFMRLVNLERYSLYLEPYPSPEKR
jgi:hypothetical protein